MNWTAEQEAMWRLCAEGEPPAPTGDQDLEAAIHFSVGDFLRCCDFEGVVPPPWDEVESRMRAMFPASVG